MFINRFFVDLDIFRYFRGSNHYKINVPQSEDIGITYLKFNLLTVYNHLPFMEKTSGVYKRESFLQILKNLNESSLNLSLLINKRYIFVFATTPVRIYKWFFPWVSII